ncbi:MAG TPA: lipocalin family protein, partial [Chloroflexota bacterium]|nr:lipocalin family protein [Chloroflexota bacterium]
WWYYTGHLYSPATSGDEPGGGDIGRRTSDVGQGRGSGGGVEEYGFELVFFRGVRGDRPPGYAAHFAVTDLPRQRFRYDQRADVALNERGALAASPPATPSAIHSNVPAGATADESRPAGTVALPVAGGGFDLALGGWRIMGREGQEEVRARMPGYALDVRLDALRPPALHQGDPPLFPGLISFGPAGYSYYYSRTRMALSGTLEVDGEARQVQGEAWMDHQWGDFLVLGGGGWDWFAGTLRDGRDVTVSIVRDPAGTVVLSYGTLVEPGGETRHLPPSAFVLEPSGQWTSPHTGIRYPSGWRLRVPEAELDLRWTPLLLDQELDTRPSTGVIYWEGAVRLEDAASGADVGRGYVELTGYSAPR